MVELYILAFVAVLHGAAWAIDKWEGWKWRRSGNAAKAEHVRALAGQLYLAKGYEKLKSASLVDTLHGSSAKPEGNTRQSRP